MIILIAGASHTGKTFLSQKLLETYHFPYLSIDHLKMGLIRSGHTTLTPKDDEELVGYLWPIVREMIKTAIENKQNLIVEGVYIPFDWKKDFSQKYWKEIRYCCLVMTKDYVNQHFDQIKEHANVVEKRLDDSYYTKETLIEENQRSLQLCQQYNCHYLLIEQEYDLDSMMEIVFL